MEYGESDMDLTNLLVSGAAGSGKTHLRHYIYGQLPPETRISTACIESAHRGIIEGSDSKGEVVVVKEVNDMRPLIASTVHTLQGNKGKDSKDKDSTDKESKDKDSTDKDSNSKVEEIKVDSKAEESKVEDSETEESKVEDSKAEDNKVEDSKVEDSKAEERKGEES